ncbi:hypothetical protein PPSIR1_24219 [Plesiocystis pacifica SIR-1]|uniref:Uncharacterized protein n=1 Tax=Plesiocystis pacifica SIR-1 TaxID=391625 RepID=A6GC08_9BACT|nr:hypothetical protein [Plesiocystis pacifica]EDM76570.1 hypothetical protein PPSIR1_24219 [Plesiocystis pacifica SIR-1]
MRTTEHSPRIGRLLVGGLALALAGTGCTDDGGGGDELAADTGTSAMDTESSSDSAGTTSTDTESDSGSSSDAGTTESSTDTTTDDGTTESSTDTTTDDGTTETTGMSCAYPDGAVEPMALNEVLWPYSWSEAIRADGTTAALDLEEVPCDTDAVIDWSIHDLLVFISVPAW